MKGRMEPKDIGGRLTDKGKGRKEGKILREGKRGS